MVAKNDIMKILDLENADFNSLQGITELQRRLETVVAMFTESKLRETTDRLSGENAEPTDQILIEIDNILDEKRAILQRESSDLQPIAWEDIETIEREWIIPNWLPANTVTMFTGKGGAGKSWLTLQLLCNITSKAPMGAWGDTSAEIQNISDYDDSMQNTPQTIVFATYEDEPAEIKRRLNALTASFEWVAKEQKTIQQHFHIIDMRAVGSVWGPGPEKHISVTGELLRSGEALRSICERLDAKLLVLDPLSGAFGGNENDRTAVYDFISSFRGWGDKAKCAMLVIGHLPKTQGAGFSGSTAWEASARAMWLLTKKETEDKEQYYALEHTKGNYAMSQEDVYLSKSIYGWWEHVDTREKAIQEYQKLEAYYETEKNTI